LFLRDAGETEIGAFGLSRPGDLLYVEDLLLIEQETGPASVVFDDLAVAEFFEQQIDAGRHPSEFSRVWIHTHPGSSPTPSFIDEETFARVFGRCDWAVMAILARGGASYARLNWNTPPGGAWRIPAEVDFSGPFAGSDELAWQAEYERCVRPEFLRLEEFVPQSGAPHDQPPITIEPADPVERQREFSSWGGGYEF
jgi:hypothetical protein